ncbi:MAG: RNA methyltransferase [Desulfurococcus sp.]|nr:RNA methyltransferase [Desulfurococcus sp.]
MELRTLLSRPYGSLAGVLAEKLKSPPRRMYIRVNTLRVNPDRLVEYLNNTSGFKFYRDEYVEEAVYTLIEGPFELECEAERYVVVDDKTAVSLMLGANLYRPGVVKWSFFEEGDVIAAVSRSGVRVACLKTTVSSRKLASISRGLVAFNTASPYRAPRLSELEAYAQVFFYPQGYPSIVTTRILDPRPGELIVDLNASPGGKTSHVVQLTRGKALVIALDRSLGKIQALKNTLTRLGLDLNVIAIPHDSRYVHVDFKLAGRADRVLVDPPCSNLGVRPILTLERDYKSILDLSAYQKQFLKAASIIAKPGGVIVYSTCTLTVEENEWNIAYAVRELGLESVELAEEPPFSERVSYKGIVAYRYSPLSNDMPGYFIAVLRKPSF